MEKVFYKVVFTLLFANCFSGLLNGQNRKIDSLMLLLKKDIDDTNKVIHLNKLGWQWRFNNPDTAILLSNEAMVLSEKINWKRGKITAIGQMGVYNHLKSEYPKALEYYFKALKLNEEMGNKSGIITQLSNIGAVYGEIGDHAKGTEYSLLALKVAEEINNKELQIGSLINIGIGYIYKPDYSLAINYFFKALKISEEIDKKETTVDCFKNIGNIYSLKADSCLKKGNKINADKYFKDGLDYFFKTLKMVESLGDQRSVSTLMANIGSNYTQMRKYKEAYNFLNKSFVNDNSIGAIDLLEGDNELLSDLYASSDLRLPDSTGTKLLTIEQMRLYALFYFKKAISIHDTLLSEENKNQMVRKEMTFDFEKKVSVAKAEQLKNEEIARAESKKQKIVIGFTVFGLIVVAVFAFFIFRALKVARRQKIVIEHQKDLVDEKQKEILDSIRYAKRIQTALITSERYIEKSLRNLRK